MPVSWLPIFLFLQILLRIEGTRTNSDLTLNNHWISARAIDRVGSWLLKRQAPHADLEPKNRISSSTEEGNGYFSPFYHKEQQRPLDQLSKFPVSYKSNAGQNDAALMKFDYQAADQDEHRQPLGKRTKSKRMIDRLGSYLLKRKFLPFRNVLPIDRVGSYLL